MIPTAEDETEAANYGEQSAFSDRLNAGRGVRESLIQTGIWLFENRDEFFGTAMPGNPTKSERYSRQVVAASCTVVELTAA